MLPVVVIQGILATWNKALTVDPAHLIPCEIRFARQFLMKSNQIILKGVIMRMPL